MRPESSDYDVLTMGRVSVDLYPEQSGVPLAEVRTFAKSLGGSPTNVAVAAARYGHRTAVITRVGEDGFGDYVRAALRSFGVDDRHVGTDPRLHTPVVFCELHPPDHFPILFYREGGAPDGQLDVEDLDVAAIRGARTLWTTGTGLARDPARSATLAALAARARKGAGGLTIHDLDYRPLLWDDPGDAGDLQRLAIGMATVVVGGVEEAAVAVGAGEPLEIASRLLERGPGLAVVKLGPAGAVAAWSGGSCRVGPVEVEVVNGLGAGDAFGGALCHGLLRGWDPERVLTFANAAGAWVAARLACADAMPTEAEVESLLEGAGQGAAGFDAARP